MVEEIFYIFLDKAGRTLTIFFSLCAKLNLLNEENNKYSSPSYFQIESKILSFLMLVCWMYITWWTSPRVEF